jgi:hypothetical protein
MEGWLEQSKDVPVPHRASAEKERERDRARDENLPIVQSQAAKGKLPFNPVRLTPVKSPGIYEGEFGSKDGDVILHFWPYGYHQAERDRLAAPRFVGDFPEKLKAVMEREFGSGRVVVEHVPDLGSWCVTARGWAAQQFHMELAIKACERLHLALGGKVG